MAKKPATTDTEIKSDTDAVDATSTSTVDAQQTELELEQTTATNEHGIGPDTDGGANPDYVAPEDAVESTPPEEPVESTPPEEPAHPGLPELERIPEGDVVNPFAQPAMSVVAPEDAHKDTDLEEVRFRAAFGDKSPLDVLLDLEARVKRIEANIRHMV